MKKLVYIVAIIFTIGLCANLARTNPVSKVKVSVSEREGVDVKVETPAISTNTPAPTSTPLPPTATPEPIVLSSIGQQATNKFTLRDGLVTFKMTHTGQSNFAIWLLDSLGGRVDLLANDVGPFDGSKALGVKAGEYLLDVQADGEWSVEIRQ